MKSSWESIKQQISESLPVWEEWIEMLIVGIDGLLQHGLSPYGEKPECVCDFQNLSVFSKAGNISLKRQPVRSYLIIIYLFHFSRPTSHVPAAISKKAALNSRLGISRKISSDRNTLINGATA